MHCKNRKPKQQSQLVFVEILTRITLKHNHKYGDFQIKVSTNDYLQAFQK